MFKKEFQISNEEFKNQFLHVLSEDTKFSDKVRKLVLTEEVLINAEVDNKKEVVDINEKENEELNYLRKKISKKEDNISQLELKIKELEEEMKYFEKLKELYKTVSDQLKNTEEDKRKLDLKKGNLEKKVEKYTNENNDLLENNHNLKETRDSYKSKLAKNENENKELKKKVMRYENQFVDMIEVHKKYLNLSNRTKESLSGVFKDESLMGFVACGIQESNIESLWDYIKDEIKEEKYEGVNELKEIFKYLFNLYQLSNPKYGWQEIEIGANFDTEYHIRHSSGKVSGKIEKVMLKGYENKKNGRIIRKSLVKVG